MRDLGEHTGAIAGFGIAADRTPVLQVFQDGDAVIHDLVRWLTVYGNDKAYPAGIVLIPGIVKPLWFHRLGVPLSD
jgi:hypothetical protein